MSSTCYSTLQKILIDCFYKLKNKGYMAIIGSYLILSLDDYSFNENSSIYKSWITQYFNYNKSIRPYINYNNILTQYH